MQSLVKCTHCSKQILKDNRHVNESKKLNGHLYCSRECFSNSRLKQAELLCEYRLCHKPIRRTPSQTSPHNFCSYPCAANYSNEQKWGINCHRVKLTDDERIARKLAGSYLGGMASKMKAHSQYTDEIIITAIKNFVAENGRIPVKRELNKYYHPARRFFGTWNNAVIAAGYESNPVLFAKKQTAFDGHLCDSITEKLIDDFLSSHNIIHQRNTSYPEGTYTADFLIGSLIIEYFGLTGFKPYDSLARKKKRLLKKYHIPFIEILPRDPYKKHYFDKLLSQILRYQNNT